MIFHYATYTCKFDEIKEVENNIFTFECERKCGNPKYVFRQQRMYKKGCE